MTADPAPDTGDAWRHGAGYERFMGRWSRQLAPRFLQWLDVPAQRRWLDVGCGTGALSAAVVDGCAPAALTGVDPSPGFLATARQRLPASVTLAQATATRLPLADGAVDVAAASLALNFVPDTDAALREMARVCVPGGLVACCVWDYAGRMDLIRHYWDAVVLLQGDSGGRDQGERFPICRQDALAAAFAAAGLERTEVVGIELPMRFADFDDYWQPFLAGQGPAPAHATSLDPASRERLRQALCERLPRRPDGSIHLVARAWAARGTVARDTAGA